MPSLEERKKAFREKEERKFSEIKALVENIEDSLGHIDRKEDFELIKRRWDYFYKNDYTGNIQTDLNNLKEIFEELSEEGSDIMRDENNENICTANFRTAVSHMMRKQNSKIQSKNR